MKLFNYLFLFVFFNLVNDSASASDKDKLGLGLGVGALYGGLGANVNMSSSSDFKYLSVGCLGYSSQYGSSCGIGIGWINTSFIEGNIRHGIGLYLGHVGVDKGLDDNFSPFKKNIYGGGVSYNYFSNGISNAGLTFGASYLFGSADFGKDISTILFQVGYQF